MKSLFDEICIGSLHLKNRLIRSATWEAMADESGRPTPRLTGMYRELASGGIGLIITGATTFARDATRIPGMLAIPDETYIPAFRAMTGAIHDSDALIVMQLAFTGRNGEMWEPARPETGEIERIIRQFGDAALRAQLAGFDGIQVHAAHGYFLSSFLNARKNTRSDRFGGDVLGRERFLLGICDEIRARTGDDFPVLVKINCSDFEKDDGVWDTCRAVCMHLAEHGASAIEISGGVSGGPFPPPGLDYTESVFRDYAAGIAGSLDIPVILVGLNRDPEVLNGILATTAISSFSFSRPLLRQPDLPEFWLKNPDEPAECTSCDACRNQPDGNICPFRNEVKATEENNRILS